MIFALNLTQTFPKYTGIKNIKWIQNLIDFCQIKCVITDELFEKALKQ